MTETTTEPAVEPETELEPDEELEPSAIDEEHDLEPELEPELEPDEPDEAQSTQALLQSLEREETRHSKAIAKALGVELEALHECPTCDGIGYTPEAIDKPAPLVQDPYTETCSRCAGNGEVLSGATARGLYTIPCNGCGGSGYVTKQEQPDVGTDFGAGAPPIAAYMPPAIASPQDAATVALLRSQGYTILEPIEVPPAAIG